MFFRLGFSKNAFENGSIVHYTRYQGS